VHEPRPAGEQRRVDRPSPTRPQNPSLIPDAVRPRRSRRQKRRLREQIILWVTLVFCVVVVIAMFVFVLEAK